eukprot:15361311-Ditylum_brightwellii.AAC.1
MEITTVALGTDATTTNCVDGYTVFQGKQLPFQQTWIHIKIPLFATKTVPIVTALQNLCPSMDPVLGSPTRP